MSNLIERQAAIDDLDTLWDYSTVDGITASTVLKQVRTDIMNLPSVQEQHWIPVSERLPERNGWYLISDEADAWIGFYTAFDREWSGMSGFPICTVFAWMPLPEPWKGEEDEPDK